MANLSVCSFTIYLIKSKITTDSAILVDKAKLESQAVNEGASTVGRLYYKRSPITVPSWVQFFGSAIDSSTFRSASTPAVLLVRAANRVFAITFGYARFLLQPGAFEENFGLRVTLNAVSPERIRMIDRRALDSTGRHAREQASREIPILDFGLDVERDLLRGVTARPEDKTLGTRLSGTDGLAVSTRTQPSKLKSLLAKYLKHFRQRKYKKRFPWVDNIAEVRDKTTIADLNEQLVQRIRGQDLEKLWLAVPDLIEWDDVAGFAYSQSPRAQLYEDISFETYLENARNPGGLDLPVLRRHRVYRISAATDQPREQWSLYRCIHAEFDSGKQAYLLNNGKWFQVASEFMAEVNETVHRIPETSRIAFLEYDDKDEPAYNRRLAKSDKSFALMDRKNIPYGGGTNSVEFCDIMTRNRALVHVKRYGGSSVLSHLVSQGVVSGTLFLADATFRRDVNRRLPKSHRLRDPKDRPNPNHYEIAYAVISESADNLRLPFFTRVTLRNAHRQLRSYGYAVTCTKIAVAAR